VHSSLCNFFAVMKHSNLYFGLVLPSGGWQSLIVYTFLKCVVPLRKLSLMSLRQVLFTVYHCCHYLQGVFSFEWLGHFEFNCQITISLSTRSVTGTDNCRYSVSTSCLSVDTVSVICYSNDVSLIATLIGCTSNGSLGGVIYYRIVYIFCCTANRPSQV
jgi:hypothetical protein